MAGLLLFLGGLLSVLGIMVAETQYPGYSVSQNYISDLGVGPAALLFNTTILLLGLLVLASMFYVHRAFGSRLFTAVLALSGLGAVGVGIFNENFLLLHLPFALTAFISSAASAIVAARFVKFPFNYVSAALGALSLAALVLMMTGEYFGEYLGLGAGGMERMIAYPTMLWMLGFGGYLMADKEHATGGA
ncbi:MAG: DUF998 domain-containing protein [Candidatus Bathyarchaeia archaeon]